LLVRHIRQSLSTPAPALLRHVTLLALIAHSAFLQVSLFKDQMLHLNFYTVSPLICFVMGAVLLASLYKRQAIETLLVVFYPLSMISLACAAWAPANSTKVISDPAVTSHIVLSIIAYSLITIAALQALLLAIQEQALRKHQLR